MSRRGFAVSAHAAVMLLIAANVTAQQPAAQPPPVSWASGPLTVPLGAQAQLGLLEGQAFANAKDTQLLMEAMGNPTSGNEVGLVRPEAEDQDWILVFEHHPVGFVKDDEKDKIDKDAILKGISEGTEEGNKRRKERGIPGLHVTGWFEEPHYDPATHNLVWALRAKDDNGGEIVNYNMRILGREGYMSVTLVEEPAKLAESKRSIEGLMKGFSYNSGKRYAEFRSGDKLAEYGLVALIAGGTGAAAVKLGLFAALWKFIAKGGKAVILLAVAALAGLRRVLAGLFGRGREAS